MAMKESFLIFKSFYEPIKGLSLEDKGMLFDAIFNYQINGIEPTNTSRIFMPFMFFKNQFRLDNIKYQKTIDRNKLNGAKGGRPKKAENQQDNENPKKPKKPSGLNGLLEKPKKADNVNDNVNDNVKEEKKKVFNFRKELLNLGIENNIIDDWLKVRKTKKATNTETAFNSIKKQIELCSLNANDCIKLAVEKSWSGFKSEWAENAKGTATRKKTPYDIDEAMKDNPERMNLDYKQP